MEGHSCPVAAHCVSPGGGWSAGRTKPGYPRGLHMLEEEIKQHSIKGNLESNNAYD